MSIYDTLNEEQREAVFHTEGPLLLLAGAGSGKTRVLTHRVAYIIEKNLARPWEVMAITFTNKAAKEMRERVDSIIGHGGRDVWVSTFHSSCVRFLRQHIDLIGYDKNFTIYDTDDAKKIIREGMKSQNIDPKQYKESGILSIISSAKNQLMGPDAYKQTVMGDMRKEVYSRMYIHYQERLKKNNALDFDDLLFYTVELFRLRPDVLEKYQERFKYVMVDEYQDTNGVQFKLISQLAGKYRNLCVVGDDDQSIYKFRGADITNILDFEKIYKGAKVIKLEQNYRSTKTILDAANHVIKNNTKRKAKRLWTDNVAGALIKFHHTNSEKEEAQLVVDHILENIKKEKAYNDHAILYRTNAQSRVLEERLVFENIPYRIFGGTAFYQRKEIKDVLSYLRIVNNSIDDLAVKRVINVPRRGIGATTIDKLDQYAQMNGISFFDAVRQVDSVPGLARAELKITGFRNLILSLKAELETMSLMDFMEAVLKRTNYIKELEDEGTDEAKTRIENIGELVTKLAEFIIKKKEEGEEPSLSGFLEEVALIADIDNLEGNNDVVVLMTLHSAKGLEFPTVFLTGMEDGLFPSYMSISTGNEEDIEEERRLAYVGITRAEEELVIIASKSRMIHGQTQYNSLSRFVREIPEDLLENQHIPDLLSKSNISNTSVLPKQRDRSFFTTTPYQNKSISKPLPVNTAVELDYKVGDLVKHVKFGIGQVLEIEPGGADYQVTVNFPRRGRKKLLAMLSGLKKM
jgi:DNA helicase-2/ATP-dependent DNA helicase PcrA